MASEEQTSNLRGYDLGVPSAEPQPCGGRGGDVEHLLPGARAGRFPSDTLGDVADHFVGHRVPRAPRGVAFASDVDCRIYVQDHGAGATSLRDRAVA